MKFFKSKSDHIKDVLKLQTQLKSAKRACTINRSKIPSNTLRNSEYKKKTTSLDLSSLTSMITINPEEEWVEVEPRMTLHTLCQILLKRGFTLPVVPEFTSITIGGAIMGAAIESSSHHYGQFNDCCLAYELLLGNGELLSASPNENSDLFYGLSGSYGSLAILTLAKIGLIKAKPYVKIFYHRFSDKKDLISFFKASHTCDFMDGIVFSDECCVGMEGTLVESDQGLPHFRQRHFWDPWFYHHVHEKIQAGSFCEVMSLKDYLFRLDRGAFWMGCFLLRLSLILRAIFRWRLKEMNQPIRKLATDSNKGKSPSFLFRLLFGWAFSSRWLYQLWHKMPNSFSGKLFFVQDFYVPIENAEHALEHFLNKTEIFPVWLCPVKGTLSSQFLSPHFNSKMFINMGLYGIPPSALDIPSLTQVLEEDIIQFGGRKMLYSLTYYTEELFSKIYDTERYRLLRKKFHAEGVFLPLYNKVADML